MRITKCDICKKTIGKKLRSIHIGLDGIFLNSFEICSNCGEPVLKLLKDSKLIISEDKKHGK